MISRACGVREQLESKNILPEAQNSLDNILVCDILTLVRNYASAKPGRFAFVASYFRGAKGEAWVSESLISGIIDRTHKK